ncbi:MAG: FG-GAP-like repeat-containing protein, partial [Pseudomonadales bacterium]
GDFNQDGRLDLFVGIDGGVSRLFMNQDDQHFRDIAQEAGFSTQAVYGVAAADYDRDGDADIFLTQCLAPAGSQRAENVLLRNDGNTFTNVSSEVGITDDLASWGVVWLDYDNDGWMDFYVVNIKHGDFPGTNTLYRNAAEEGFIDVSAEAGVEGDTLSNGIAVAAADFDNDGWMDLYVVDRSGMHNLYRNNGNGTFTDVLASTNIASLNSQSVAVADVNGDGWIDLFIPSSSRDLLLLNEGGTNHYLKIATRGTISNHFGVGTRLDLYAGGLHQVREINAGDGMTSQNHNLSAHFGLGETSVVDSLVVRWPSSTVDRIYNVGSNQEITVVEGVGLNNAPARFSLRQPNDGGLAPVVNGQVNFVWEPTDDEEQDPISYTLYLRGPGVDTTFTNLSSPTFSVDAGRFVGGQVYRWTVSATDGYSVRGTPYFEFAPAEATAIEQASADVPEKIIELATYPNPFHTSITLSYRVAHTSRVVVTVYDVLGRAVHRLLDQVQLPGAHEVVWDGRNEAGRVASSGVYLVRVETERQSVTRVLTRL